MDKLDLIKSWFTFPSLDDPKVEPGFSKNTALVLDTLDDCEKIYEYIHNSPNISECKHIEWKNLIDQICKFEDLRKFDYVYIWGVGLGSLSIKLPNSCGRLAYLEMTPARQRLLFYQDTYETKWEWQDYTMIIASSVLVYLFYRLLK